MVPPVENFTSDFCNPAVVCGLVNCFKPGSFGTENEVMPCSGPLGPLGIQPGVCISCLCVFIFQAGTENNLQAALKIARIDLSVKTNLKVKDLLAGSAPDKVLQR